MLQGVSSAESYLCLSR